AWCAAVPTANTPWRGIRNCDVRFGRVDSRSTIAMENSKIYLPGAPSRAWNREAGPVESGRVDVMATDGREQEVEGVLDGPGRGAVAECRPRAVEQPARVLVMPLLVGGGRCCLLVAIGWPCMRPPPCQALRAMAA